MNQILLIKKLLKLYDEECDCCEGSINDYELIELIRLVVGDVNE